MEHHHKRQPRRLGLGLPHDDVVPAEQGREQDSVAEAGNREQLGRALEHAQDDRLKRADQIVGGGEQEHEAAKRTGVANGQLSALARR